MSGGGGGGGPGDFVFGPMWYSSLHGSVVPGLLARADLAGDPGCCRSGDCCLTDVACALALDSPTGSTLCESLALDELLVGGAALYGICGSYTGGALYGGSALGS